jgi:WhiB family transcriptional regulator, redox-sensing transcriptional regulator
VTAPAASSHRTSWRERAACRSYDPEIFFPIGKTGRAIAEIQRAKTICANCPIRADCLAFALQTHQDYGIWGGCDEDERRALRRQRRLAPCCSRGLVQVHPVDRLDLEQHVISQHTGGRTR